MARAKGARSDLGLTGLGMIVSWPDRRQMSVPRGAGCWIAAQGGDAQSWKTRPIAIYVRWIRANACMG